MTVPTQNPNLRTGQVVTYGTPTQIQNRRPGNNQTNNQQQIVQIQNPHNQRLIIPQPASIGQIFTTADGSVVFNQGSKNDNQNQLLNLQGRSILIQQQPTHQGNIITHAGTQVLQSGGQLFRVQSTTGNRLVSLGQNSGGRVMVGRNQNVQLINKPIQPIQQQKLVNQVQVSPLPQSQQVATTTALPIQDNIPQFGISTTPQSPNVVPKTS